MPDIPCRYGDRCREKGSGCNFLHNGDQAGQNNSRRGGPPTGPRRTLASTIGIGGANRWGKPRSSGGENPSTAWNLPTQNNASAGISKETATGFGGNSGWGSSDNNNASKSKDTSRNTGETNSWATDDATFGWGVGPVSQDNGGWGKSNFGGNKDTTSGWGTSPQDNGGWGSNNSGGNNNAISGWGSPGDNGGWGPGNAGRNNNATSGSGAAPQDNGGWGPSNSGGNNDSGGWGTNPADTAKTSDAFQSNGANSRDSRGQDQPTASSFGGLENGKENSSDRQKDKVEGMRVDIPMREPSPPRKQDEPKPKSAPPSPCISESPAQTPLSPKYAVPLSAISPKIPPDFKAMALEATKLKTSPVRIKGVEGRKAFYKNIIKHTKNAIIAFLEQQEAQTDLNRWKNTQMSAIYGHATQKTRRVLDSERATYRQRLQDVEEAFHQEINALLNLPESRVSDNKKKVNVLTKEVVAQYTQELQDWFKDLELHKRLLTEEEDGEIIADEAEEGEVIDPEEENTGQRVSELLRSGECTWNKLVEAIEELEKSFDATQTSVYFDIFTCIDDDSKAKLRLVRTSLPSIEQEETKEDRLSAVSAKIATAGQSLERQSEGLARLLDEIAELENQVEAVRVQTTEATLVCQLAGRLFGEFEQWKEADNAQITAIAEQMQLLRLHNTSEPPTSASQDASVVAAAVPSHPSSSSWSAPESIPMSDLINPIRRLVIDAIRKELKLCFDNLRHRCIENQQKLEAEMEEEAKKIMLKAEIVKSRITPSRDSSAIPVAPPNQSNVPLATR